MKRATLTTVIVAVATASVFAQGTVSFHGNTAHVSNPNGTPLGANGFGQLLGAPGSNAPESNLIPAINGPSSFSGGQLPSFIATFNNIPPDAPFGSFELVAWDNSSGLYPTWLQASVAWQSGILAAGKSPEVTLALGGIPPPVLFPVPVSFKIDIIPEPSAAILLGFGVAALSYAGRRK
jgi:hypothetical protein